MAEADLDGKNAKFVNPTEFAEHVAAADNALSFQLRSTVCPALAARAPKIRGLTGCVSLATDCAGAGPVVYAIASNATMHLAALVIALRCVSSISVRVGIIELFPFRDSSINDR